ncbi:hypothetical protein KIPB_009101 [Kipferlia bialata]|uniref:Kelch-type beta propeller n=1 Tax=Kipferlia bialata TaxID=797122 RepID=A0A9K3D144_9EUKA|nr:hypothetical protein KIPB_009101 [Kipferlia bialata]|eukprot:g9101.t1
MLGKPDGERRVLRTCCTTLTGGNADEAYSLSANTDTPIPEIVMDSQAQLFSPTIIPQRLGGCVYILDCVHMHILDIGSLEWTHLYLPPALRVSTTAQTPRARGRVSFALDGLLYVLAEATDGRSKDRTVQVYDPDSSEWTTGITFRGTDCCHTLAQDNERAVIVGLGSADTCLIQLFDGIRHQTPVTSQLV